MTPKSADRTWTRSMNRSKHYPHLGDYLDVRLAEMRQGYNYGVAGGVIGGIAGLLGALFGILVGTGVVNPSSGVIVAVWFFLNIIISLAIGAFFLSHKKRRERQNAARNHQKDSEKVAKDMLQSVGRRKLHKELDPVAGRLLEEGCRNFMRIQKALDTAFWAGEDLPAHWQGFRDQARLVSNQAMDEILVIFAGCMSKPPANTGFFDFIEDVVDNFKGGSIPDSDTIPAGYEQAREIAERLKLLASEVEDATGHVFKDATVADDFISTANLESTLNELRTIRKAEDELRENLRS